MAVAIGAIAAAVIGGAVSAYGASQQNKASQRATQAQMDFQERMSNTQYQRAMADMRLAGLNPILAYKQGGAGVPSGSTYSPVNVGAGVGPSLQAGVNSALTARKQNQEISNLKAAQSLTEAQEDAARQAIDIRRLEKRANDLKLQALNAGVKAVQGVRDYGIDAYNKQKGRKPTPKRKPQAKKRGFQYSKDIYKYKGKSSTHSTVSSWMARRRKQVYGPNYFRSK